MVKVDKVTVDFVICGKDIGGDHPCSIVLRPGEMPTAKLHAPMSEMTVADLKQSSIAR